MLEVIAWVEVELAMSSFELGWLFGCLRLLFWVRA